MGNPTASDAAICQDDEQGILRISIGGCDTAVGLNYCVIRGDLGQCIDLLEKALVALRDAPVRNITDLIGITLVVALCVAGTVLEWCVDILEELGE